MVSSPTMNKKKARRMMLRSLRYRILGEALGRDALLFTHVVDLLWAMDKALYGFNLKTLDRHCREWKA